MPISIIPSQLTLGRSARPFNGIRTALLLTLLGVMGLVLVMSQAYAESIPGPDKSFLNSAAEAGNAELKASKLALEKSNNPDVKTFASLMVDEHTTLRDDLKKLAASKDVSVPDDASMTQRAKIAVLEKLHGTMFDKQYVGMIGVSAHKDAVKLFSKAATDAKDPDVKDFAVKSLPSLQHHLALAQSLKAKLDDQK